MGFHITNAFVSIELISKFPEQDVLSKYFSHNTDLCVQ